MQTGKLEFIQTVPGTTLAMVAVAYATTLLAVTLLLAAAAVWDTPRSLASRPAPLVAPQTSATPSPSISPTISSVEDVLRNMTLEEKVGQMMIVGIPGTTAGPVVRTLIRDYHVGGVVLLGDNVQSPVQVAELTSQLQILAQQNGGIPLVVAIDHEGGIVTRFTTGVTELPGNMALGATRSTSFARGVARVSATELESMGINANLAPVLDVNDNPQNPVIGLRSFGEAPGLVATLGLAYIEELQSHGVIATAKHFPGHGSTSTDSHSDLPVVNKSREQLESGELVPFRAAVQAHVGMIMTAQVAFTALDEDGIPATLSSHIVNDLLRGELGYDGVVISDDMAMKAVADNFTPSKCAVMSVQAGIDFVLVGGGLDRQKDIYQALLSAVQDGSVSEARIDASVTRILRLKMEYGLFDGPQTKEAKPAYFGQRSAGQMRTISEKAVTLVRNSAHFIPVATSNHSKVLVVSPSILPSSHNGTTLGDAIGRQGLDCIELVVDLENAESKGAVLKQAAQLGKDCDWLLVATWYADSWQATLVHTLFRLGKPLVVIALGTPYDLKRFPEVTTYLAVYGKTSMHTEAAARAIFGEFIPSGKLPVSIPKLYSYGWVIH